MKLFIVEARFFSFCLNVCTPFFMSCFRKRFLNSDTVQMHNGVYKGVHPSVIGGVQYYQAIQGINHKTLRMLPKQIDFDGK